MNKFLRTAVASGAPFGAGMALYFMSVHGTNKGLVLGLACGLFFGVAIATIQARRAKAAAAVRPTYEAEGILRDAVASRIGGKHVTHGWLFLTKQRLVFAPSNSAAAKLELRLTEIADVNLFDKAIRKQMHVVDKLGQTNAFIVLERELWVITLSRAVEAATQAAS